MTFAVTVISGRPSGGLAGDRSSDLRDGSGRGPDTLRMQCCMRRCMECCMRRRHAGRGRGNCVAAREPDTRKGLSLPTNRSLHAALHMALHTETPVPARLQKQVRILPRILIGYRTTAVMPCAAPLHSLLRMVGQVLDPRNSGASYPSAARPLAEPAQTWHFRDRYPHYRPDATPPHGCRAPAAQMRSQARATHGRIDSKWSYWSEHRTKIQTNTVCPIENPTEATSLMR